MKPRAHKGVPPPAADEKRKKLRALMEKLKRAPSASCLPSGRPTPELDPMAAADKGDDLAEAALAARAKER
jgi:hypothetical protein